MKRFAEFTSEDLWTLRNEIVLNSLYVSDYENTFNLVAKCVCDFFDGYCEYLKELATEKNDNPTIDEIFAEDNEDNLFAWFCCFDDYSWMMYDLSEDDLIKLQL